MDKEEALWNIHSSINEWVRFSDTKAALILGVYGAVGAFALPGLIDHMGLIGKSVVLISILVIGIGFSVVSALMSLWSLAPTLKVKRTRARDSSIIYFNAIADNFNDPAEYYKVVKDKFADGTEIQMQVSHQIWTNSIIARKKYVAVKWSIRALIGSTASGIIFLISALVMATMP